MSVFKRKADHIKNINVYNELERILSIGYIQDELIKMNQEQLKDRGVDSDNNIIRTFTAQQQPGGYVYSLYTMIKKYQKGQPTDKVTLFDTGSFYASFRIVATKRIAKIVADFNKSGGNMGENIDTTKVLGLINQNMDVLVNRILYPLLRDRIWLAVKKK